jgi:DNA-binding response OmpR family regulator
MAIAEIQKKPWVYVLDERIRILVADDDPILREFATVHLASPLATIETAPDGTAAFAMLMAGEFDIALIDIEMPPLDGFGLIAKIRAEPKLRHLPIMMLTGHEDIASVDRAYDLGANSFVPKPVNWRLLSYHIRYVMRSSRIEQELRRAKDLAEAEDFVASIEAFGQEHDALLTAIVDQTRALRDAAGPADLRLGDIDRIETLARAALSQCQSVRHAIRRVPSPQDAPTLNGGKDEP